MRDRADVVVIGAGIMGLSIAYHLAELGVTNVTVVDKGYLCGGASGRNGGGVRAQWSNEANVMLMLESIRMCRNFAHQMKINVWFRQGGYLFVARTPAITERLEQSVALQKNCGLATRMLTPNEARRIVPELDTSGIEGASYNPDDGVVFPWPFV
ncbi:MAG TPA: FAD-dependent oxidoreductase, partial [Polyangiaceae bacterium]|nr:FAD-dependent oxidoreductase [Polyangiaceae bacterium]